MDQDDKATNKRGLGRGLSALFEDEEGIYPQADEFGHTPGLTRMELPIEQLNPGQFQPRKTFDQDALKQLAESVSTHGILQPILVRQLNDNGDSYEIIAGERRWRAAQLAQLHEVPVILAQMNDEEALEIALIENLQREDLNALEEAEGYQRLIDQFGHTQGKLAAVIGKSRSHIANTLRLLTLPENVQAFVNDGSLSAGHARALITAENPIELAKKVVNQGLSVRETERLAKETKTNYTTSEDKLSQAKKASKSADTLALEEELSNKLGLEVKIDLKGSQSGELKIRFKDYDQLDDVIHRLSQAA
ncbi:MAG: chromosome partitioning protein ParB [Alphaproteobacteria bacterium]|nr:chromosome partitioning protein ParB [Alphaproteobacteria bacterium]|tara:strand:+ start:95489 stop:96406 length:918 start_codon:yes stop_codon:yes gene_type:complete